MKKTIVFACALVLSIACVVAPAEGRGGELTPLDLPATEAGIESLRVDGPRAMEAVLKRLDARPGGLQSLSVEEQDRLDRLCGVRDCARLRLFWYTDFDAARAAAEASGKPILSLRLLGRLDEDYSCANSRFFRTVLYANSEIGRLLRKRFVLHWRSVRPVPKVTIDFGDGRVLNRTLAGNSIHYVLDRHGRLVDGLPGLYGPKTFSQELRQIAIAAKRSSRMEGDERLSWLSRWHLENLLSLRSELDADLAALGGRRVGRREAESGVAVELAAVPAERTPLEVLREVPGVLIDQVDGGPNLTGSKSGVELPLLRALQPAEIGPTLEDGRWKALAALHPEVGRLDAHSRAFLLHKHGVQDSVEAKRLIASFESSVALDTIFNQYQLRRTLSGWLEQAGSEERRAVEAVNTRVYGELFGTPAEDPWLGLAPGDVYTALPAAGVVAQAGGG